MEKPNDIVSRFIELAAASCPSFTDDIALGIEQQIRQEFGTEACYVAKTLDRDRKAKDSAVEEARRSGRVREAAERNGISRATLYRLLRRKGA